MATLTNPTIPAIQMVSFSANNGPCLTLPSWSFNLDIPILISTSYSGVAQSVEQVTVNHCVAGSIPAT